MALQVHRSTTIRRPIEETWPFVADLDQELRWRSPYVLTLEQLDEGPVAVGTRIRGTTRIAGSTGTYVNEVTELAPPHRYAWRGVEVSGGINASGCYELRSTPDGGTVVTIDISYQAERLAGRIQMPMLKFLAPRIIERFLGQLTELASTPGVGRVQGRA